ncbi:hypothetical protein AAY473_007648 [Plecturocebus cupreus]
MAHACNPTTLGGQALFSAESHFHHSIKFSAFTILQFEDEEGSRPTQGKGLTELITHFCPAELREPCNMPSGTMRSQAP